MNTHEVSTTTDTETLFYDGHCGLCHRGVKFVIRHDRRGVFRFAPLGGPTFTGTLTEAERSGLPDSMVLRTRDGKLLLRSGAWVHILKRLGGGWRILGALLAAIPRPLRDWGYDFIAAIRFRVFGRREEVCPLVPQELRKRFDA
ncbi:MAG TPA: DCC1-like thiol-disulfide oxidoreductase family protein [Candidatus Acidoferrales bacterium]|nr:DCC1-like thiol-disulfide oxidoreductase family protein [Candidatus Acidoferrales bacterium]